MISSNVATANPTSSSPQIPSQQTQQQSNSKLPKHQHQSQQQQTYIQPRPLASKGTIAPKMQTSVDGIFLQIVFREYPIMMIKLNGFYDLLF